MNTSLILRTLGLVLLCEAGAMLPSLGIALFLGEADYLAFAISIFFIAIAGFILARTRIESSVVGYREGFIIATAGWLFLALFGSLPFIISGAIPGFIDAFFETMSGFTTTGASVLTDVEILSRSILFWRSITHWLGGMGIIVLTLALIPSLKIAGMKLFRAEVPGPAKSKVLPRVAQTSRELYKLYFIITVAEILALKIAGLSWFDSFIQTFGTVATGGFSNKNASVAAFNNPAVEYIIVFFMFLCGMNFALHFHALRGNFRPLWKDPETRMYTLVTLAAVVFICINLITVQGYGIEAAFRQSAFQSVSILTTTGFATADYNQWPAFSQGVLFLLMFIGGCAGSTAGGIKNVRYLILFKNASREITKMIHPKAIIPVRLGRDVITEELVESVVSFFFLYLAILLASTLLLTAMGIDLISSISAVAATLGNIGPGFGAVGPATNYAAIPAAGKLLLALCMLVGRLEVYTVLVVFSARLWRS
ncbi:TrkH family potassium uptake protein [Desulfotruncus alcoholivorax]|uniref:TrkH family potassium uptake protein n=1 Tax=Desulfotruncus alcoholivorax TaxID=265477 RepID=UPI00041D312E|nr:TrkH family potassium uptake protein [Desulfotruncus alcoholivorax]